MYGSNTVLTVVQLQNILKVNSPRDYYTTTDDNNNVVLFKDHYKWYNNSTHTEQFELLQTLFIPNITYYLFHYRSLWQLAIRVNIETCSSTAVPISVLLDVAHHHTQQCCVRYSAKGSRFLQICMAHRLAKALPAAAVRMGIAQLHVIMILEIVCFCPSLDLKINEFDLW